MGQVMIWKNFLSILFVTVAIIAGMNASRADSYQGFKVVELFTSQSCSSCPAADKVLQSLSQDNNVITLGYHVTYWDHLSWKDKLSLPEATALQKQFNAERGSGRVYTPQMVINGTEEFIGSHKNIAASLLKAAQNVPAISMKMEKDKLHITIPQNAVEHDKVSRLMLIRVGEAHYQQISSGENSGRNVFYSSPVLEMTDMNQTRDSSSTITVELDKEVKNSEFVAILREGQAGKIIAAGILRDKI